MLYRDRSGRQITQAEYEQLCAEHGRIILSSIVSPDVTVYTAWRGAARLHDSALFTTKVFRRGDVAPGMRARWASEPDARRGQGL